MSVINTNVSSLIAQNALSSNARAQTSAMQQLSTGLRINSAKDDAAGLAIAAKMTSQIKGLDQAVRNGNDAISMLQTADGALSTVGDMLQRMRELAVQSSSDTNVSGDRAALNNEFNALKTEIGRVGATTQWNGMGLLDGTGGGDTRSSTFTFQLGANNTPGSTSQIPIMMKNIATGTVGGGTKITLSSQSAVSSGTQTTTSDAFAASDMVTGTQINAVVNGKAYSYTVTANDVAGGTTDNGINAMLQNVVNAYTNQGLTADAKVVPSVSSVTTDKKLVFTGTGSGNAPFGITLNTKTGGLYIDGDISTQTGALTAIATATLKIADVNAGRSDLGATINRLAYAVDNLSNVSQNTSASRSRVQDTDYAKASTELARTQIISQAATAMLAQANQSQQSVLALLK
jgi:flagellin